MMKNFRVVQPKDTQEILSIYQPYVEHTAISFEYTTPDWTAFAHRIESISREYPYIVCEQDQHVIGYAYAHRLMEREAYQWDAELSVYIHPDFLRCGIGSALYGAVIEILQMQNICNVYAGVTAPNEKSEKLHQALGFNILGTYHRTGYKCGAWHDVIWFEKSICNKPSPPKPFMPIHQIKAHNIHAVLKKYTALINHE